MGRDIVLSSGGSFSTYRSSDALNLALFSFSLWTPLARLEDAASIVSQRI